MSSEDKIRERAFRLWVDRGRPEGQAEQHWLDAEREVRQQDAEGGSQQPAEGVASADAPSLVDTTLDTASPRSRKNRTKNGPANRGGENSFQSNR
jgi:hypothetical protein